MRSSLVAAALAASLGLGTLARAEILIKNDGGVVEGKVVSQDSKEVVFQQDGADAKDPQHIDRSLVSKIVKVDEHGGLLPDAGTQPTPHWNVPPEPAAPPITRLSGPTYYLIPLHGEVGATVVASALEKSLADAVLRKPTVVVLDIDSPGGLVEESQRIIKVIHHYNKQLRIVAFTDQDLSAAAIFSLSVKAIYVKSSSTIGAATSFIPNNMTLPPKIEEKMQSAWRAVARNSAEEGGHEPLLAEAMIDNDLELHLESVGGKNVVKEGPGDKTLCRKGKILTLSSHEAVDCGLAVDEADDLDELGKELNLPGWKECKGLGTLMADYLPKRADSFKAESARIVARFEQSMNEAKQSDPEQVISRVVRTGAPMYPQPPMPGRYSPMRPGFRPPVPTPGGGTTVITTVSRSHWKARSLACTVALQQAESNLGEGSSLALAYGQAGVAELFHDAQTEIGALRARIYDDRNKYGDGSSVAIARPPVGASGSPNSDPGAPADSPMRDPRLPPDATETESVGGRGGGPFVRLSKPARPVLGFRYGVGQWGAQTVMRQFEPLYAAAPAGQDTIIAKDGYAVAGLDVDFDNVNVLNLMVVFARLKDGRLDLTDTYKSDWLNGKPVNPAREVMTHRGTVVVGIFGRKGLNLATIGLIMAPATSAAK